MKRVEIEADRATRMDVDATQRQERRSVSLARPPLMRQVVGTEALLRAIEYGARGAGDGKGLSPNAVCW